MSKRLFFIIISLISYQAFAQSSFSVAHPDCRIRIKQFTDDNDFIKDTFLKKLKERNYKAEYLVDNKRLIIGDIYITMKISRPSEVTRVQKIKGKNVTKKISPFYKACFVKLEMRKSKGNSISSSDQLLFSKEIERGFPRVTFKGNERCTRALRDAFIHIPNCIKQN